MLHRTVRRLLLSAAAAAPLGWAGPARAQDGPYVQMDLGVAAAPGLDFTGADNDWATKCDLVINPSLVEVTSECDAAPAPATWSNAFGGGTGIRAGAAFGYRLGAVRIEGEYFQRVTVFDERSDVTITDVVTLGKQDQEIASAVGGLDDLRSHAFFANAYYDFTPAGSSWTPYVGAGMERASIFTHWTRNDDPNRIATFADPALRAKLAGTTTIGSNSLTDSMAGYQVLAGVDRRLGAAATLGLKFRWAGFGAFASGPAGVKPAPQPRLHREPRRADPLHGGHRRQPVLGAEPQPEVPLLSGRRLRSGTGG